MHMENTDRPVSTNTVKCPLPRSMDNGITCVCVSDTRSLTSVDSVTCDPNFLRLIIKDCCVPARDHVNTPGVKPLIKHVPRRHWT